MVFNPPDAPFVALAFLSAGFLVVAGSATALFGLLSKRRAVVVGGGAAALVVAVTYAALWLGASIVSRERVLRPGDRKYFCEIDCHLAYSVARVERVDSLPGGVVPANGSYAIVTVETWFDPSTISARRPPGAPLYPNPREVFARDGRGRTYAPLAGAAEALVRSGRSSTPMTRPLRPGESYETLLVFDVSRAAPDLRLFIGNIPAEAAFLIGHEAGPLHRKVWFGL